jgi:hypothetical protein
VAKGRSERRAQAEATASARPAKLKTKAEQQLLEFEEAEPAMKIAFTPEQREAYASLAVTGDKAAQIAAWKDWVKWTKWWARLRASAPALAMRKHKPDAWADLEAGRAEKAATKLAMDRWKRQARKPEFSGAAKDTKLLNKWFAAEARVVTAATTKRYNQAKKRKRAVDDAVGVDEEMDRPPAAKKKKKEVVKCKRDELLYSQKKRTLVETARTVSEKSLDTEQGVNTFTRVIGLRPTTEQRLALHKFFAGYRATYNEAVAQGRRDAEAIQADPTTVVFSGNDFRDDVMRKAVAKSKDGWVGEVDMRLRQRAGREYNSQLSANLKKRKQTGQSFCMRFKSVRRARQQAIPLGTREVKISANGVTIFPTKVPGVVKARLDAKDWDALRDVGALKREKARRRRRRRQLMKTGETEPSKVAPTFVAPPAECKLVYDRGRRRFSLHVPLPRAALWHSPSEPPPRVLFRRENRERTNVAESSPRVVMLDPGVRTFLTGYSPSGEVFEVAAGASKHLCDLAARLDKVSKDMDAESTRAKRRARLRRVRFRLFTKIKNLVDEVHWKAANFLCKNFDVILLPEFGTQGMVRKQRPDGSWKRRIGKNTSRRMLMWAHYRFRLRLLAKAQHHGKSLVIVDEAYTSMTCTRCGAINGKLGSSKEFRCPVCEVHLDRDVNGARNVGLLNVAAAAGA